jgi:hypothetical protein
MKEVLALEPVTFLWKEEWQNKHVYVHSDDQCAVSIINKGTNSNTKVMSSLLRIFWWSIEYNFRLTAVYYPRERNALADWASRLLQKDAATKLFANLQSSNFYKNPESETGGRGGDIPGSMLCSNHPTDLQVATEGLPDFLPPHEHTTSASMIKYGG